MEQTKKYVRRLDAAERLNISPATLDRWAKDGLVHRVELVRPGVWFDEEEIAGLEVPAGS
jgi:predicted site-specific integrase-resolvase